MEFKEEQVVVSCVFTKKKENTQVEIMLGRHANGPYKGLWGVASSSELMDKRPQRRAARLAEYSCLGLLGPLRDMEPLCKHVLTERVHKSKKESYTLHLYTVEQDDDSLPYKIVHTSNYIESCYEKQIDGTFAMPENLLPWIVVKWIALDKERLHGLRIDPYSRQILNRLVRSLEQLQT
jgi:hypothetical protein